MKKILTQPTILYGILCVKKKILQYIALINDSMIERIYEWCKKIDHSRFFADNLSIMVKFSNVVDFYLKEKL